MRNPKFETKPPGVELLNRFLWVAVLSVCTFGVLGVFLGAPDDKPKTEIKK